MTVETHDQQRGGPTPRPSVAPGFLIVKRADPLQVCRRGSAQIRSFVAKRATRYLPSPCRRRRGHAGLGVRVCGARRPHRPFAMVWRFPGVRPAPAPPWKERLQGSGNRSGRASSCDTLTGFVAFIGPGRALRPGGLDGTGPAAIERGSSVCSRVSVARPATGRSLAMWTAFYSDLLLPQHGARTERLWVLHSARTGDRLQRTSPSNLALANELEWRTPRFWGPAATRRPYLHDGRARNGLLTP